MTPKIPVTVLAGAMGAGKTTLINRIVSESGQRILVIQNELGEVTVEGAPIIATDEEIFEMDDGLVCGTVRGDLIRALVSVTRRREQYDRILIEATGPADPGPIVRTFLMDQEIQRSFRLDGLAMLVDGRLLSSSTREGKTGGHEQIVFANVLIVNKTDMVSPGEVAEMERWLRGRSTPPRASAAPATATCRSSSCSNIDRHAIDRALGRGTRPSDVRIPAQQRPSAARMAAVDGHRAADGEGQGLARRRRRIPARDRVGQRLRRAGGRDRGGRRRGAARQRRSPDHAAHGARGRDQLRSRGSRARRASPPPARTARCASCSSAPTSR